VVLIDKQARENYGIPLSNIVYMGMGEPLLNYKNVLDRLKRSLRKMGLEHGCQKDYGINRRHCQNDQKTWRRPGKI
jgi:23S rRNA (adenine2503-C2)-methyltransferase